MKLSVIVPAYNVEVYIEKCIKCLLEQKYKNIEIIIVDDGSTDNTSKIIDELFRYNKLIKIVHKDNGGLSSARNAGLEICDGDYVFFLDADDWIDDDYFANCMDVLNSNQVDVLMTAYIREYKKTSMKTKLFSEDYILFDKSMIKDIVVLRLFGGDCKTPTKLDNLNTAWGKFYKRRIIKNIKFEERSVIGTAEDLWYNINVFGNINSAIYIGTEFVHYNKSNVNSLVSTYHPEANERLYNLYNLMENYIKTNELDKTFVLALNNRIVITVFSQLLNVCNSSMNWLEKRKCIFEVINTNRFRKAISMFDFEKMSIIWKIFYKCAEYRCVDIMLLIVSVGMKLKDRIKR